MTELKTLKDIRFDGFRGDENWSKKRIKEEAIKWIKYCRRRTAIYGYNIGERLPMAESDFMEFHNITEEDLK